MGFLCTWRSARVWMLFTGGSTVAALERRQRERGGGLFRGVLPPPHTRAHMHTHMHTLASLLMGCLSNMIACLLQGNVNFPSRVALRSDFIQPYLHLHETKAALALALISETTTIQSPKARLSR